MKIWLLDGSKNAREKGELSYETQSLLEEARVLKQDIDYVHISDVTSWQQTLRVKNVPVDRYPNLVLPRNMDLNTDIHPIPILKVLENRGAVCMNSREGMGRVANKIVMGRWLIKAGLPYPKTINFAQNIDPEIIVAQLGEKLFLKQAKGAEGTGVAYCTSIEEFNAAKKEFQERNPNNPLLVQEAIGSSLGRDVRAFVIGDQVVATMLRRATRAGEVRANISLGGKPEDFDLPEHAKELVIKAAKALKLDHAGGDLLFLPNGRFILCEMNRTADWSVLPQPEDITRRLMAHGIQLAQHGRQ